MCVCVCLHSRHGDMPNVFSSQVGCLSVRSSVLSLQPVPLGAAIGNRESLMAMGKILCLVFFDFGSGKVCSFCSVKKKNLPFFCAPTMKQKC